MTEDANTAGPSGVEGPAVSRDTAAPAEPAAELTGQPEGVRAAAAELFGARLDTAVAYAGLLATDGVVRGLIGPREVPRLWERHLLNCAALTELVPADSDVLDIGSGAGLPGIPLAVARPDLWVTLVEPMERRTAFLTETVERLGLDNVEVLRSRAESVSPKGKADVVTSRAVAALPKLAGWCLPLARRGGLVLAIKGSSAPQEVEDYVAQRRSRRAEQPAVVRCGEKLLDVPTTVIRLRRP
ncbi:16S rRNA m(7)G-527 methyltransferase [Stackebrandtia albiflava]|uniref:Ribosomal RNA small subunit methyltransferase G n=1 Tax=Stackebrandtia albiflava TaxID=406432 RepID=A0A562V0S6_9ACTN|nr:16S rRNA (guanine(527)-N(7))-methyltransferase RsmG [Stackebrandtia albiflava]TWJ11516.1 16S rRNA m(7)G-527 methyltransferase [Stackebrandtia albiflava]